MEENKITKEDLKLVATELGLYFDSEADINELVTIITSKWVMYSKNGCPYCAKAEKLLEENGISFAKIVVTPDTKAEKMAEIKEATGVEPSGTFPQILRGDELIGGFSELQSLSSPPSSCVIS